MSIKKFIDGKYGVRIEPMAKKEQIICSICKHTMEEFSLGPYRSGDIFIESTPKIKKPSRVLQFAKHHMQDMHYKKVLAVIVTAIMFVAASFVFPKLVLNTVVGAGSVMIGIFIGMGAIWIIFPGVYELGWWIGVKLGWFTQCLTDYERYERFKYGPLPWFIPILFCFMGLGFYSIGQMVLTRLFQ